MSTKILIAVALGIICGIMFIPMGFLVAMDNLVTFALCVLLFWVGIDIGGNKSVLVKIRQIGFKILIVPVMVALGSIFGAGLGGMIIKMPFGLSAAVGSGFGWYTLSAVIISDMYSAKLGTIAFLSNVFRELFAIVFIPVIAKYIGHLEAIAPAGATAMDTSLPIISESTSPDISVISFISGVILSSIVPILVPLFLKI